MEIGIFQRLIMLNFEACQIGSTLAPTGVSRLTPRDDLKLYWTRGACSVRFLSALKKVM
jgi:hypothetical protein